MGLRFCNAKVDDGYNLDWYHDLSVGEANLPPALVEKILGTASRLRPRLQKQLSNGKRKIGESNLRVNTGSGYANFTSKIDDGNDRNYAPVGLRDVIEATKKEFPFWQRGDLNLMLKLVEIGEDLIAKLAPNREDLMVASEYDRVKNRPGPTLDTRDLTLATILTNDGTTRSQGSAEPHTEPHPGLRIAISLVPGRICVWGDGSDGVDGKWVDIGDSESIKVFGGLSGIHASTLQTPEQIEAGEPLSPSVVLEWLPKVPALA